MKNIKLQGIRWLPNEYEKIGEPDFLKLELVEPELKRKILDYLSSGEILSAFLGLRDCKFGCPLNEPVIYDRGLTDGVWVWPYELIHYVSVHDVDLPEEFVQHMKMSNFNVRLKEEIIELISKSNITNNDLFEISYDTWDAWLKGKGEDEFLSQRPLGLKRKITSSLFGGEDIDLLGLLK